MSFYSYLRENEGASPLELRKQGVIERLERPSRLVKARMLGYRAKEGFVLARVRVKKGGRKRPQVTGGRKPKRSGRFFTPGKNLRHIAEERAARKFPNLEVLNSYWVAEDGKNRWFEIIMLDPSHPVIASGRKTSWILDNRGRTFRGKTAAGRRSRGL